MDYGQSVLIGNLHRLELREPGPAAAAVYDRPIRLALLYEDPETGEEHYIVRYPPGVRGRLHRHSAAHTIVVLEGTLEANGQLLRAGSYAHFPPGQAMRHQATAAEGCLFVLLFHGPFDAEVIGD